MKNLSIIRKFNNYVSIFSENFNIDKYESYCDLNIISGNNLGLNCGNGLIDKIISVVGDEKFLFTIICLNIIQEEDTLQYVISNGKYIERRIKHLFKSNSISIFYDLRALEFFGPNTYKIALINSGRMVELIKNKLKLFLERDNRSDNVLLKLNEFNFRETIHISTYSIMNYDI